MNWKENENTNNKAFSFQMKPKKLWLNLIKRIENVSYSSRLTFVIGDKQ